MTITVAPLFFSKVDVTQPVLLSSFDPPLNLHLVNFPSELSPLDIIWSSNNSIPSSLLASYNPIKSTISLWEVELSSMAQQDSDAPRVEEATPTQKRASLRHPNGGWSPLAFRPPPATPNIPHKERPQNWTVKLLLELNVPFREGACEANFLENTGKQESQQHSLCFTNAASGCQVIISLGGDWPPQFRSMKYGIVSSAVVSPNFGPGLAADSKGILELHQDGLLIFGSPSHSHQLSFRAILAQNGLPYLNLLDDGSDEVIKEVMMSDLAMVPVGMQLGSNRRVTLSYQGPQQPKARVSLDAVPLVSRELGSNFTESLSIEEHQKLLPWSSLQGPAATGDAELEMDALLRLLAGIPQKVQKSSLRSLCHSKLGERFSWIGQENVELLGSKSAFDFQRENSVISKLVQNAKLNILARRHIVPLLLRCMRSNDCEETASGSPSTDGPELQDKLLHFENLLAWQGNSDGSSAANTAQSIVRGIVDNIFHEAKGIDPVATKFSPCNSRIAVDTLPAKVVSAVQYLARSPWTPYSKISSQLSNDFFHSESETSIMPGFENLDVVREEDPEVKSNTMPYDFRLLRLPADSSIDNLDGATDTVPAILEATCILDSSIPAALRGKAGRQGIISLQKTLAILASRQLALPLGRGALGLQTHRVLPTEQLRQPAISLAAEVTERNHAVINLDLSSAPPGEGLSELSAWPEFHAGVAEGLLLASSGPLTRTWVVYSKPGAPSYSYGGVLLGLGLAGHLGSLSGTDMFRYLSLEHEPTLMGFLLGIAAAKRSIIAALLEQFKNVKQLDKQLQTRGKNGKSAEEEENVDLDCEMAVLAAGIAVGLVVLGNGGHDSRYTALQIQLRHFIEGSFSGICDRQGRGQHIDIPVSDSTSVLNKLGLQPASDIENSNSIVPAATVALGLMYLKTNDFDAAAAFQQGIDDEICPPRHLTLKIMMRALILWDDIAPTEDWVWNCIPRSLAIAMAKENHSIAIQAHCFSVAGACLALGIKFAGTKDTVAAQTLVRFVHYFLKEKCKIVSTGNDDEIVENCMAACALSLSVVLAGSGDLKTFKLLRSLLKRVPISQPSTTPDEVVASPPFVGYGSYSALSLALGFLFLSGGEQTFDTTQDAAAFLVIALFPHLPTATWDNRYYLQALLCNPAIAGAADILL
ncbi:putative Anaphase-promoting complex subunit 1 [Nannochloris sp. 'desiccata']|nr:putative Anaphase-promoting complex subunit 1 [Chlorella desiccata (nom. nud.)]